MPVCLLTELTICDRIKKNIRNYRKVKNVFIVGTSHIDPAWLWERQDGYSEVLATFRSALDRMKEFPKLRYAASSAAFFGLVKEANPEMLEEIKERVREWLSSGKLGFASSGIHGYDYTGEYFSPTLLRTAIYADHFTADGGNARDDRCENMGIGRTEISYALYPTDSASESRVKCDLFNMPPRAVCSSFHEGDLAQKMSFFESDSPVLVSSIKMAEDGDGAVIRAFELEGKHSTHNISLFGKEISVSLGAHAVATVSEDGRELYFTEREKGAERNE